MSVQVVRGWSAGWKGERAAVVVERKSSGRSADGGRRRMGKREREREARVGRRYNIAYANSLWT